MIFPILFALNCSWRGVEDVAPYRVWLKPHSTDKSKFESLQAPIVPLVYIKRKSFM